MFTDHQLGIAGRNKAKSLERLSTGYKINRAADNAAGLSISEKMRAQIRGLYRSQENIQDGISYCNVADGALNEVHSMLDRVKELSVQSANDTYSDDDRKKIDNEVQQLKKEMSSVFENTEFNTIKIWQAAYIPDAGGKCTDFSLYNVTDTNGSYYGGIEYMNHRYSWEDLGITNWDVSTHTFTSSDKFEINAAIFHNNGSNLTNDTTTTNDDYISSGSGAIFTINTFKDGRAIDIQKNYSWSANDNGISIDGVMTDGTVTVPPTGNTTWAAMGLTAGNDVAAGSYTFNYYGMDVSFDVNNDTSWSSFLQGFNNPLVHIDWHSRYLTSVSKEVADISNATSTIMINNSNKDYIAADSNPYTINADEDGIWMVNSLSANQDFTKSGTNQTLIRWEDIANAQDYYIKSWGLNTGGDSSTNENSPTNADGGDKFVTLNSNAIYVYQNALLGGGSNFSFDMNLLDEASRAGVISDINNTCYVNQGITSPTAITSYTPDADGFSSSPLTSTLNFLTQRDKLNRTFSSNTELFANGALSSSGNNYTLTLNGTNGGSIAMNATVSCSDLKTTLSNAITSRMTSIYNATKAASGNIGDLSDISKPATLGLGQYTMTFQDSDNNSVSLQLDLSNVKYGDIISSVDYNATGVTPDDISNFATRVSDYFDTKMQKFLNTKFDISGNGATYQNLSLQENSVHENVVVNEPVVNSIYDSLTIQSGANENSGIEINYEFLRLGALGIKNLDVLTREDADCALTSVNNAIEKVSQQRSVFGASVNRLQCADNVNGNTAENLQDAESKLRDADMAKEMVDFWKHNILEQVGQTVLSQANQNTKNILSLLQ